VELSARAGSPYLPPPSPCAALMGHIFGIAFSPHTWVVHGRKDRDWEILSEILSGRPRPACARPIRYTTQTHILALNCTHNAPEWTDKEAKAASLPVPQLGLITRLCIVRPRASGTATTKCQNQEGQSWTSRERYSTMGRGLVASCMVLIIPAIRTGLDGREIL
jgi:hypothetical protein